MNMSLTAIFTTNDRAVSETVGYIVLIGVVITSTFSIIIIGQPLISNQQTTEYLSNTETAFTLFSENVDTLLRDTAPARQTEIKFNGGNFNQSQIWTMSLTASYNGTTETYLFTGTPFIYRKGDDSIHYSAGAVLQTQMGGGTITEPPPFRFHPDRTILSIITPTVIGISPDISGSEKIALTAKRTDSSLHILTDKPATIEIRLTTPQYRQWADYFEGQGLVEKSVTPSTNTIVYEYSTDGLAVRETSIDIEIEE